MDSPVRKQLKRNDYLRHKMFRKIKRRRKAEQLLAINAPAKELRRRLKLRTFKCGKDAYSGGKDDGNILMRPDGSYFYQDGDKEISVIPLNTTISENPADWNYTDESGKIYTPHKLVLPQAELSQTSEDQLRYQLMIDNWRNSTSYLIADRIAEFGDPVAVYDNIRSGKYGTGALAALGLLAGPEDLLKTGAQRILKKVSKPFGVQEYVWNDLFNSGWRKIWDAKKSGDYAFTKKGHDNLARTLFNTRITPAAQEMIDKSLDLEREQFMKRMYGKYSDRFEDAPWSLRIPLQEDVSPAEYELLTALSLRGSLDIPRLPHIVRGDPRYIRRSADFKKPVDDVYIEIDPTIRDTKIDYSGQYSDGAKSILIPMHTEANSGFLNPYLVASGKKKLNFLLGHEYTHHLLNQPNFAQNLALSVDGSPVDVYYNAMPQEYIFGKYLNPFLPIYDRSNARLNEINVSEKLGLGRKIDPELEFGESGYMKYGRHNASPDEAVADLRGMIVSGFDDEAIYGNMFREYGMNAEQVDLAREMGYSSGKDSGIHIKPENRGKFTRLKKRTGKSASWFKAHGTPAQKKMAVFALNSRKWSHKK